MTLPFPNDLHFRLLVLLVIFSRPTPQNPTVFSSDSHVNVGLTTNQYSSPSPPNRANYPLFGNITLVTSRRQDPRVLYLATHKLNANTHISDERRRKQFHRLDTTNLESKFEITAKFHKLSTQPIPYHNTVNFKSILHPLIATNPNLLVSDHTPFRLLHGSNTFLNTLTFLKYTARF